MKSLVLLALIFAGISPSWAAPVVSNVRVSQRSGTNLVDVYYNLSGSGAGGASVAVELSDNGGNSYGLPISSLSGQVGSGIANGTNRYLVWDAGTDRPNSFSETMRLRLTAVDTPPVPPGFALIPAGSFQMGQDGIATPVHSVYVSAFYMAKYETTKALWDSVRTWGLNNGYTDLAVGGGKASNHPVQTITWYDMVKWCNARSQKEGLTPCYTDSGAVYRTGSSAPVCNWSANGYRLPTEAEWEKAARGGLSEKRFPWGDTITHSQANYCVYSSDGFTNYYSYDVTPRPGRFYADYYYHPAYNSSPYIYAVNGSAYTSPVGSFLPNGYGLYDMAGNMWEWCWDWFDSYTADSQTDPRGAVWSATRVGRGGGWGHGAHACRVAIRSSMNTGFNDGITGFRLARSSVP